MDTALGLTLLRVVAGLALITHGWPKLTNLKGTTAWMKSEGVPLSGLSALFAAVVETFGGALIALGVFVPYVAIIICLNLLGALVYHLSKKHAFKGMEDAVLFLAIFACLAIVGGGAYTLIG